MDRISSRLFTAFFNDLCIVFDSPDRPHSGPFFKIMAGSVVIMGVVVNFQIPISMALLTISWTRSQPRSIQERLVWHARHGRFMLVLHALFSRGLHMVTWITRTSHARQGTIPFRRAPLASSLVSAVRSLSCTSVAESRMHCLHCLLDITACSGILYPAAVLLWVEML